MASYRALRSVKHDAHDAVQAQIYTNIKQNKVQYIYTPINDTIIRLTKVERQGNQFNENELRSEQMSFEKLFERTSG